MIYTAKRQSAELVGSFSRLLFSIEVTYIVITVALAKYNPKIPFWE